MNLPFRTFIFWLHLAAGLIAGSIVLIMSVTGVLLMYEQQIIEWADRDIRPATPPPGTARLGVERLLTAAAAAWPGASPSAVTVKADLEAPALVSLGREQSVYVDPFTGRVLGEGSKPVRAALHAITDWHRWLGVAGEGRDTARKITGACNLAFLFLIVSGFYLWVPRRWTRRQVRNVAWFRGGLSGKARDFNWHNTIGLWIFLPLFVIVLSGVFISYPWAGDLLLRLTGDKVEPRREGRPEGPGGLPGGRGGESKLDLTGLDGLWARAEQRVPGWQTITLRLPRSADAPVAFTILSGGRGRPDLRAQLTLDRATGEVESWQPYASQSTGRKVRSWMRWLHTGEAGGFLGQTLAGLASAGAAVLVWTGVALSWRRFFSKAKNRDLRAQTAAPEASNRFEGVDA